MGFNCLKAAKSLLEDSLLFTTKSHPGTHLVDLRRMMGWINLVVLNSGPLDWESSALITRPMLDFLMCFACKTLWRKSEIHIFEKIDIDNAFSGLYPEQISYWLTSMSVQKNVPKKQKVKLLTLTCLFVKRKFKETHKDFSINYPYNNKCGKTIFSF